MSYEIPEIISDEDLRKFIPDFKYGKLDELRKLGTFDWRRMKIVVDTRNTLSVKNQIWDFIENNPDFRDPIGEIPGDEQKRLAYKRTLALRRTGIFTFQSIAADQDYLAAFTEACVMYDGSMAIKEAVAFSMFENAVLTNGSDFHYNIIEDLRNNKISGCFALTEVAHGSNAKGMRTKATYCPEKKAFVIHTPDFEAAKFWPGSLGMCATHAVVYASLITNGQDHGLHLFLVPIRDPNTLEPYPGVIVGDVGPKVGLNGVDNGFLMFDNYYLPKEYALAKNGGVDENGDYKTPFRDPNKRFGASLAMLSSGRVHIAQFSILYLMKAIVIAIRYSSVRTQFGPDDSKDETRVLMYRQQQIRLLPYLAAVYAHRIFNWWFLNKVLYTTVCKYLGTELDRAAERGLEIHALSSAAKAMCSWMSRDGIQNCREACGGHGYLKAAEIGDLRNDNDANCTYEGENSVIVQQASKFLLAMWPLRRSEAVDLPYGSLDFMIGADDRLQQTCQCRTVEDMVKPENLISAYKWLAAYTCKITYEKVKQLRSQGKDSFESKNDSQPYYAVSLALIYAENFVLEHFYKTAMAFYDENCKRVLLKLVSLYGSFLLEKHLGSLYAGGYLSSSQGLLIREGVLSLCEAVCPEAVLLADAIAPPDSIMKSVLGKSDGEVYKHIHRNVMTNPGALQRPSWWREIVEQEPQSKL